MLTPKKFKKLINQGIVTSEMMALIIYSLNKRAKNHRDSIRELNCQLNRWNWHTRFGDYTQKSIDYHTDAKDTYYKMKDYFLSYAVPESIHHQTIYRERTDTIVDLYFLYYQIDGFGFHHPIDVADLDKYSLPIHELPDDFTTYGDDVEDLLSVNFCKKVYTGMKCNALKYVA